MTKMQAALIGVAIGIAVLVVLFLGYRGIKYKACYSECRETAIKLYENELYRYNLIQNRNATKPSLEKKIAVACSDCSFFGGD